VFGLGIQEVELFRQLLKCIAVVILVGGSLTEVNATPLTPHTPPHPPQPRKVYKSNSEVVNRPSSVAVNYPPLKAVLVVGPIDGDDGAWTMEEKQHMDLAAEELEAHGVEIHKFYTPDNDWEQIEAAAEGAHFLLYRGHGILWSPMPAPTVGGFALKDRFASSDDIRKDLKLAPNAIVMLYGCFAAGSSSSDGGPINSQEAQRRVAEYSDPFLDTGAAGYYSNWYGDAFKMFLSFLFQGMTLGEAYESYFDFSSATVERYVHQNHSDLPMWLDKDDWGHTQYNNAFVGQPDQTLSDLFGFPVMMLTPSKITHLAEPSSPAHSFRFKVDVTGPGTLTWTANAGPTDASWLDVRPRSGYNGQEVTVVLTPTDKAPGTYQGKIHVVAESPWIGNAEQNIIVTMRVSEQINRYYVPTIFGGAP
jgi:hypothetical protein